MSNTPDPDRIAAVLQFAQDAEQLKDTLRTGITRRGRQESTAEHSWRLCLIALLFARELPEVDLLRLLKLCLVHDLGEAISGDVPATQQHTEPDRALRERSDLLTLCAPLPPDLRDELVGLWDEYAAGQTAEALAAKGFDKIETMLQHLLGLNPPDFDYAFNLSYGKGYTDRHPLLAAIRDNVDRQTRERLRSLM
ncbi:MAG: HD domain-containing protein [Caulobacter sp.]|nr:HD domain-containing protein [Caulobacter sp.]